MFNSMPTPPELEQRTGTFFCEMTTAQSLPRTPTDVMFAAVIALNAYSVWTAHQQLHLIYLAARRRGFRLQAKEDWRVRTDLV